MRRSRFPNAMELRLAVSLLLIDFAARADGGEGGRRVQCGDTITASLRLTHDLECPGTEAPALRITGTGVVLDLGGHTVRRSGPDTGRSEGIAVLADSTVKNGTIQGFDLGYVLDYDATHAPERVLLSRLTFVGNRSAVYNRSASATFTITDCGFLRNGTGLGSEQDASNGTFEVRSTLFLGNRLALSANSHSINVVRSFFSRNELVVWCPYGSISFASSWIMQNTVVGRLPLYEFGYGSCFEASFVDTMIARNGSLAPARQPAWEPLLFVLRDSQVSENDTGIEVRTATADVHGSTWRDNGGGLSLGNLPDQVVPLAGTVSRNRFLRNEGDGLRVRGPGTLTLSHNTAIGNTGWGIHASGVIDGGGNVARDNDSGDCAGVSCSPD